MRTYILFSLSRVVVYVAFGVAVFFLGEALTQDALGGLHTMLFLLGGLFIVGLGALIMLKSGLNHRFCQKAQGMFLQRDAKTVITLGLITGILPCAPLFSVVSYIGLISKTWLKSASLAAAFGMGTVASPLLVLIAISGLLPKIFKHKDIWYAIFNQVCGGVIILLGLNLVRRAF